MEKSKRKHGEEAGLASWLRSIYEPQRFDFESPLPLEACINQIQAMNDWRRVLGLLEFGKTRVDLVRLDTGNYQFTIRQKSGRSYALEARGYLRGQFGLPTAVMGESRIPGFLPLLTIYAIIGVGF